MMLLRTLVLERDGQDAPVNGALLCGFAVGQITSNFLVYSLDEEVEPASSRVYVAVLRKKLDRYFLGGVESKDDLNVAMHVFKQILTSAAGVKTGSATENQVPYHFIDLKGCKLPPARPEDHHSVIIKKALVMKVITLGMSAPMMPAIESASLIVPSIRFSSKMSVSATGANPPEPTQLPVHEPIVEEPRQMPVEAPVTIMQAAPVVLNEPDASVQRKVMAPADHGSLFEVDSTLTSLARVAQELTQQKLAAVERETALDQWQARLQQQQTQLDEKTRDLEQRTTQLHDQSLAVSQRAEALRAMTSQVSGMRQSLRGVLLELDQALDG
ncbi:hypothetical protein [Pseudomonas grimontii]|uniref:hypothetical protein n=1 Tax=Pseudomonas grimontii TaxID=129847 RepID=UPI00387B220E